MSVVLLNRPTKYLHKKNSVRTFFSGWE